MNTIASAFERPQSFDKSFKFLLQALGAVRCEVNPRGIRSHWRTQREADRARAEFINMGLRPVEAFPDNGLYAVFAAYPTLSSVPPQPRRTQASS